MNNNSSASEHIRLFLQMCIWNWFIDKSNLLRWSKVLIIADRVMWMLKQSGVHRNLKVCTERMPVRSEYVFVKLCHK